MVETAKGLGMRPAAAAASAPVGAAGGDVAAVVLAAGASSRFGAPKALALPRRPADLDHVLDAAREAGIQTSSSSSATPPTRSRTRFQRLDETSSAIPTRGGLSSSLQVGVAAAAALEPAPAAVVIVLGDQPRTGPRSSGARRRGQVERSAGHRPALRRRRRSEPGAAREAAFGLVDEAERRRGLGPLLASDPELVLEVPVGGANPDIDTPDDLRPARGSRSGPDATYREAMTTATADTLEDAWAERVRANRDQVDQVREVPDRDFYAPVSSLFVADPRRTGEEALDALIDLAEPEDRWLDVGAGAGRYALPLAAHVAEVIAVEPSARCGTRSGPARRSTASTTSGSSPGPGRRRSPSSASRRSPTSR